MDRVEATEGRERDRRAKDDFDFDFDWRMEDLGVRGEERV